MNILIQLAELKLMRQRKITQQKCLLDDIRRLCVAGLRDDPRGEDLYQQIYAFEWAYRQAARRFDRTPYADLIDAIMTHDTIRVSAHF